MRTRTWATAPAPEDWSRAIPIPRCRNGAPMSLQRLVCLWVVLNPINEICQMMGISKPAVVSTLYGYVRNDK